MFDKTMEKSVLARGSASNSFGFTVGAFNLSMSAFPSSFATPSTCLEAVIIVAHLGFKNVGYE